MHKQIALILLLVLALIPADTSFASTTHRTLITVKRQDEPVTLYLADSASISTLDPQRASDMVSITAVEQLFLGLTNVDPLNPGSITPELATEWTVSDDGTQWTFTIRQDVPWVRWDPAAGEAEILRMVTAGDIAFGMQRACDPRLESYYSSVAKQVILGCDELWNKEPDDVTNADYDLVQVSAPDDRTLVVKLQYPAGFFLSQTPMWMYRPVPREIIAEYGDDWTTPGTIVTNGPFMLAEWKPGVRRMYIANPHLPQDLRGPGNIERVVITVVEDQGTQFALYSYNQIEVSPVPLFDLYEPLGDPTYSDSLFQTTDQAVFFFGFAHDKPPFDNVHARRAFSAAIDRAAFVREIRQNRGVPMIHLTPPGIFGAPPINEVGVGYDPDYAREQLALAGYPGCDGLPEVEIWTYTGALSWGKFVAASAVRELGCEPNVLLVEEQDFSVIMNRIEPRVPPEDRPHMATYGWGPDYPDANNWVGDMLHCEADNLLKRPCDKVDELIEQAARSTDPDERRALYAQIEDMFFGPDGLHPIIPLFMRVDYLLHKYWYTGPFETDGLFGAVHYDWYSIDHAAQAAARAE